MARFTADLIVVNRLSGKVHEWELTQPLTYLLVDEPGSEVINVPPRFKTDFASVPRPFWFWIAPWGRHGRAAILHDFLYQLGSVTDVGAGSLRRPSKRESDLIFRQAMAVLDDVILTAAATTATARALLPLRRALALARRWVIWAAVAAFGFWAYRREQANGTAPPLEHEMLVEVEAMLAADPARL